MIGLLQACDDAQLLGFGLWPGQRNLLGGLDQDVGLHVWCVGRRSGKSTMSGLACVHNACLRPDLDALVRRGETRYAVAIATNLQQGRLIVNAARSVVEASPLLSGMVESQSEDEIKFFNERTGARSAIAAFPCSSRGGRGRPISLLILDEAAHFISDTDGPATAGRVFLAMRPSLAQFGPLARTIVCSTPWGTEGFFAELYAKADSGEVSARAVHAPTWEMNPSIPQSEYAETARLDPDAYRSEYAAEFVGSGDAYLDFERIEIVRADARDLDPALGTGWVAGHDPAFSRDPYGLAIVGRAKADGKALLVGAVRAFHARGDFAIVDEAAAVCKPFSAVCWTDQFASAAMVERLSKHGLFVHVEHTSAPTKTAMYAQLRARLYDGALELPRHGDLLSELRRLRTKFSAGSAQIVNPRVGGSHGDIASALALAVYALRKNHEVRSTPYKQKLADVQLSRAGLTLRGTKYMDQTAGGGLVLPPGYERRSR